MKDLETLVHLHDDSKGDGDVEKSSSTKVQITATDYIIDPGAERRLVRKIDLRFIPASMFIYFLSFIDRSNLGNAKVLNNATGDSLLQVTHMTEHQYLIALVIFIVSHTVFDTPSIYLLKKIRPSRWLAFIMFGWGTVTMTLGATNNFGGVCTARFLLGAFEAGIFPGLVYCITFWYKPEERALRVALVVASATLAGAFGGAIAFGVGHMNHLQGLQAWRWLFIIEGAPSCAAAIFAYLFYPDFPETDTWLQPEERELAIGRIKGVASLGHHKIVWREALDTLKDWRLYLHYVLFISASVAFSSVSLFSPTVVSGLGFEGLNAELFTVPPYAIGFVVTLTVSWLSDRYEMRSIGAFTSLSMAGVSFLIQGLLPPTSFKARYGMLCLAVSFTFAAQPPLLSWLTANLRHTGASTLGVPLNASIGQIGDIIGIFIYKSSEAPGYPTGHFTNAGFLLAAAAVVMVLRYIYLGRNRRLKPGERAWRL